MALVFQVVAHHCQLLHIDAKRTQENVEMSRTMNLCVCFLCHDARKNVPWKMERSFS